jgi:hypothetical protein
MPSIVKRPYRFQLRVNHRLLPKDLWATFDDYDTAERYGKQLEGEHGISWFFRDESVKRAARQASVWTA